MVFVTRRYDNRDGLSRRSVRRGLPPCARWLGQLQFPTLVLLALGASSSVVAAESSSDPTTVATRINFAPGPEHADSERVFQGIPSIERSANGRLWATWYSGGTGEGTENYVVLVTSGDDGKTWSNLKLVIDAPGKVRAFDPCLWLDPNRQLWLLWAQGLPEEPGEAFGVASLWAIHTEDSGDADPEWSEPQLLAPGVMLNKPTVLSSGEWLWPIAQWGRKGSAAVFVSNDQGATLQILGRANVPDVKQPDEHMVVERADSDLWMLVRTAYGIGESVSTDRGKTWSEVAPASIRHTVARFFVRRLKSGNLLLVKHGAINEQTGRSHLTALLSEDDGKTWSDGLLLDERSGVSYPDGIQSPEGIIYMIYDYDRQGAKEILMATFTEQDVIDGKLTSDHARLRVPVNKATGG